MFSGIGRKKDFNDEFPGSFQADMKQRILPDWLYKDGSDAGTIGSPDIRKELVSDE